ncbi:MAG TPA: transporter [Burkholderiales bacterium]|nr:transporter [Burkholderiales bacterium]
MKKGIVVGCAVALGIGAVSFSYAADDRELRLGVGADYTRGTYGGSTESTTWSIPFTARYETGRWTSKLTIPWLEVTGPSSFVPGFGHTDSSGKPKKRNFAGTTTESGVGDTVASVTYNAWYDDELERGIDLTGRIKLPTADAGAGLGTGSTDVSGQVDAYRTFDRLTLFADVGYYWFGHSDYVELKNAWNYGIGASQKMNDKDSLGVSLDGRQKASVGGAPQRELTFFWNRRMDRDARFQAYVLLGLANGSPDVGLGASVAKSF